MTELVRLVEQWATEKNINKPEYKFKQMLKVVEEIGELAGALAKGNEEELKDGIGDSFVTLIILANQCGFTPEECLQHAYDIIKKRQGKTINGVFIKDANF